MVTIQEHLLSRYPWEQLYRADKSVNKKWPFCFSPVPCYWHVKRCRRAANSGERRVNRLKTKREAESIVLEWGLEGLGAMMGQRPQHRDTGLLSARAFQEHTLPEKSLSQPPTTALLHSSLSQISSSLPSLRERGGPIRLSTGLNQSLAPRGWALFKRRSYRWGSARSENPAPTEMQFSSVYAYEAHIRWERKLQYGTLSEHYFWWYRDTKFGLRDVVSL